MSGTTAQEDSKGPAIDIRGLLKSSFNEWEGRISAVVFTARCNWRCPYCHGAHLVENPDSMPQITPEEVYDFLRSRGGWTDGVAITGGEPTLQPGLIDFIRELKKIMPVKLETNGTHPEVIEKLLAENLLDCLCLDYKAPLDKRLIALTCVSPEATAVEKVKQSYELARAASDKIEIEFHTTLCPAYINADTLAEMGAVLNCEKALWVLQQYETGAKMLDEQAAGTRRFTTEELDELETAAKEKHKRLLMRRGRQ